MTACAGLPPEGHQGHPQMPAANFLLLLLSPCRPPPISIQRVEKVRRRRRVAPRAAQRGLPAAAAAAAAAPPCCPAQSSLPAATIAAGAWDNRLYSTADLYIIHANLMKVGSSE